MQTLLIIIAVLLMLATLFALVRGIVAFLQTTEADLLNTDEGPSANQLKQNKAMMNRVIFQGLAILVLAVMMLMARSGS
jgi:Hypoxia induced protein conserved region